MMFYALDYLHRGFSVIPLKPKSKEPLIPWQEFQKRRASEAEVRGWFQKCPTANLGIVTGSISGVAIVDLDGPEGIAQGNVLGLTSPGITQTGKGKQLWYRHVEGVGNSVRKYPGVDTRGEGGYVCAPPSIHPNGKRYAWLGVPHAGTLPLFPLSVFATAVSKPAGNTTGWIAKALEEMTNGNIDITLFRVCSRLRNDGMSEADAMVLLEHHARRVGAEKGHLEAKIRNVWARYTPKNQTDEIADAPAQSISSFMEAMKPVEWIVRGLIARGTLGFVAGLPETNKTWLMMDLALECARKNGGQWLSLFPTAYSRVLFIDQERFKGETQRRFKSAMAQKGLTAADLEGNLFIRCGTTTRLNLEPSYRAFHRELLEIKPDLVIVDSFATFQTGNENDRQEVQVVFERLKALRNELGCAFLFIDHENKSVFADKENNELPSAFRMVGSVGKVAAAELVLTVRRFDADTVLVHNTKNSLAPSAKSFTAKVIDTETGIRIYGEGAHD